MIQYYTHNGAEPQGPFRIADLREHILYQDTPIWHEGLSDWTTVGNVDNLQELLKTPPPFNANPMTSSTETERTINILILVAVIAVIFGGLFVLDNVNYDEKNNTNSSYRERLLND
jgi:hypothetical protein